MKNNRFKKVTSLFLPILASVLLLNSPVHAAKTVTYYHHDALGSPVALTDENGNLKCNEDYTPYGERIRKEAGCEDNNIWFTGKPEESELGLQYFGARWYDPSIGRFTGIDPVKFQEGNIHSFNAYAYANNNPYVFVDPDGNNPIAIGIGVVAVLGYFALVDAINRNSGVSGSLPNNGLSGPGLSDIETFPNLKGHPIPNPFHKNESSENNEESKGQNKPEVGTCPGCGNSTSKRPGKIAKDHDLEVKDVKDRIHGVKGKANISGNPDVEVCSGCGEVYPQAPNGGLGDSIGNIDEEF